ncbi:transposase family protein [Streptomyces sp. NPDC057543]|uniref:helix-turn-helix domain-containing protein n=1 Tax=Streptomyces sp. NPDC057543 TaxID=3346163 RepID=UPI0036A94D34
MGRVISADDPKWIEPFSGLTEVQFATLVALVRRRGGDVRRGRPWRLPLEDRVLPVATYWRTNLTLRQVAPLFGVSKSAADRILDHLAPFPAISPPRRPRRDTVHIVDGTLVPNRDRSPASTGPAAAHRPSPTAAVHRRARARVEHALSRLKNWKVLRDRRLKNNGGHPAMLGIARLHNPALTG